MRNYIDPVLTWSNESYFWEINPYLTRQRKVECEVIKYKHLSDIPVKKIYLNMGAREAQDVIKAANP
jgi:hypothetical protein